MTDNGMSRLTHSVVVVILDLKTLPLSKKRHESFDSTNPIPVLQSDIGGKIYEPFDSYNPEETISNAIERWLTGRRFATALTQERLYAYAVSKNPAIQWMDFVPGIYRHLKNLQVDTMERFSAATEDVGTRNSLNEIYKRLLGRDIANDWVGIFFYQPIIFFLGDQGKWLVEQSIMMNPEYLGKTSKS